MKREEKTLLFELCNFNDVNIKKLKELLPNYTSPCVLGYLFFNRLQGMAYGVLHQSCLLGQINREFRNSLRDAYWQNIQHNNSYFDCIKYLSEILKDCRGKYAMLKGALLTSIYPAGYRTSNDIDLLVKSNDVTEIGHILANNGFKQGYIRNDEFIPATRMEIISSKMMRGETVPYIKEVNLPYLRFLEVDINFSLDYKNNDPHIVDNLLKESVEIDVQDFTIMTLNTYDFFIHLCGHLYKEATTLPWVRMKRDMTLYKFCDIYMLLSKLPPISICGIFDRAKELDMVAICSSVILWTSDLLPVNNDFAIHLAQQELEGKEYLLNTVISPQDHKTYIYIEKDIQERFFSENRIQLLKEI